MSYLYYKPKKHVCIEANWQFLDHLLRLFEKALNSEADYIFLDLEDAVSPNNKLLARKNIIQALSDLPFKESGKTISVRINSLDTHYMYRDLIDVMEQVGSKIDTILIPKTGSASDVYMVDCLLTQIEESFKYKKKNWIRMFNRNCPWNV